jgi:hypothetical protein
VGLFQVVIVVDGREDRSEELPMFVTELSLKPRLLPVTLPYDMKIAMIPSMTLKRFQSCGGFFRVVSDHDHGGECLLSMFLYEVHQVFLCGGVEMMSSSTIPSATKG